VNVSFETPEKGLIDLRELQAGDCFFWYETEDTSVKMVITIAGKRHYVDLATGIAFAIEERENNAIVRVAAQTQVAVFKDTY
jgi:hypothetical protein